MLLMFITNDWLNDKEIRYDDKNICRIQSTQEQHWCLYFCWLYASHWLLESWEELKDHSRIGLCTLNALAIDEPLEYAQLYLDGFSFRLTAPYSEERRQQSGKETFRQLDTPYSKRCAIIFLKKFRIRCSICRWNRST